MYIGKTNQIIELDKHDVKTVIDYCSLQIKNNVIVQNNVNKFLRSGEMAKNIMMRDFMQ